MPPRGGINGATEKHTAKNNMLAAQRILHELDHQPLTEVIKLLKDDSDGSLPDKIKADINLKLMEFAYPRLKAVSLDVNDHGEDVVKKALEEMNKKSIGFDFKSRGKERE